MKTVLVATIGTSPAVLTETIWALANPEKSGRTNDDDPILPDEVRVMTTTTGKRILMEELLTKPAGAAQTRWQELRSILLQDHKDGAKAPLLDFTENSIVVFRQPGTGRDLEDMDSLESAEGVADQVVRELWAHSTRIQDPVRLIGSLSGGYKHFGAILYGAMTLLGRPGDLLFHVLLVPRYESRDFFWPSQSSQACVPKNGGKRFQAKDATNDGILLGNVPFPKLGHRWKELGLAQPESFSDLVEETERLGATTPVLSLKLDATRRTVSVNNCDPEVWNTVPFLVLHFWAKRAKEGKDKFSNWIGANTPYHAFVTETQDIRTSQYPKIVWHHETINHKDSRGWYDFKMNKLVFQIRDAGMPCAVALKAVLPHKNCLKLDLLPDKIEIIGEKPR